MYNSFKINEIVIIKGIGKCNKKHYNNEKATIICRDPYFRDYNVQFEDGSKDWVDKKYIKKFGG